MAKAYMKMEFNSEKRIPPLFASLAKTMSGEIDCSVETLTLYASDSSHYFILPQAVMYPKNVTDIRHIVSFAREFGVPITVCGGRTNGTGGAINEGIIIDMKRYFNTIKRISMTDNVVTVDAGVTIAELSQRLLGWGFEIPSLTNIYDQRTVGGLFATRSSTPFSFHHGNIRDWVEEVHVVLDNGEEHRLADGITPSGRMLGIYQSLFPFMLQEESHIRAAKPALQEDASGYFVWTTSIGPRQLIDQLSGSEGTLGIITSFTFRMIPRKQSFEALYLAIDSNDIPNLIKHAKQEHIEGLFFFDETFKNLMSFHGEHIASQLPESSFYCIAMHKQSKKDHIRNPLLILKESIGIDQTYLYESTDEETIMRITSPSYVRSLCDVYGKGALIPHYDTSGFILHPSSLPSFIENMINENNTIGYVAPVWGNIGSGHVAITPFLDPKSPSYQKDITSFNEHLFLMAKKYKGGISAFSGDGLGRSVFLPYIYGEIMMSFFEHIKKIWDPLLILNPGKKVFTNPSYVKQHIQPKPSISKE